MLIGAPLGKILQIVPDFLRIGMKDVRAIFMYENAVFVRVIECVAGDMIAPIEQKDFLVQLRSNSLRKNSTGKAGANNNPIKQIKTCSLSGLGQLGLTMIELHLQH